MRWVGFLSPIPWVNYDGRSGRLSRIKRGIAMLRKEFFMGEEDGTVSTEMVVIIAAIGLLLGVGVSVLFTALSDYFNAWATFFSAGS